MLSQCCLYFYVLLSLELIAEEIETSLEMMIMIYLLEKIAENIKKHVEEQFKIITDY
jgi:hypothetical protein